MKFVPVPFVQVPPLLVLYCQVAPVSSPVMLIVPLLVMLSVVDAPLSAARARFGAVTEVSMVMVVLFCPGGLVVFPAGSVCLI